METKFEIPIKENGAIDNFRLEDGLSRRLSLDPRNNYVDLIGREKSIAREAINNLQSSYDYEVIKVGKNENNYLIKVGVII